MAEIRSREDNPLPGIEYSEIIISDENDLGTGTFTTVTEKKALAKINPIISTIMNEPEFQMIVTINSAEEEVTALLGKAVSEPPLSRKVFKMPEETKIHELHDFKVVFSGWEIKAMVLDGKDLQETS